MNVATQLDAELISRAVANRAAATEMLAKSEKTANPFVAVVFVGCLAGTFAFSAIQSATIFHAIVGAAAGSALALASLAYGELMRLRRRMEALHLLSRNDGL